MVFSKVLMAKKNANDRRYKNWIYIIWRKTEKKKAINQNINNINSLDMFCWFLILYAFQYTEMFVPSAFILN